MVHGACVRSAQYYNNILKRYIYPIEIYGRVEVGEGEVWYINIIHATFSTAFPAVAAIKKNFGGWGGCSSSGLYLILL